AAAGDHRDRLGGGRGTLEGGRANPVGAREARATGQRGAVEPGGVAEPAQVRETALDTRVARGNSARRRIQVDAARGGRCRHRRKSAMNHGSRSRRARGYTSASNGKRRAAIEAAARKTRGFG